jgi:hypothetical protein
MGADTVAGMLGVDAPGGVSEDGTTTRRFRLGSVVVAVGLGIATGCGNAAIGESVEAPTPLVFAAAATGVMVAGDGGGAGVAATGVSVESPTPLVFAAAANGVMAEMGCVAAGLAGALPPTAVCG